MRPRTHRRVETTIEIDAPPATVWAVLADTARLAEWNPLIQALTGELASGSRLRVRLQPPGSRAMTIRPVVQVADPGRILRWHGRLGLPGLFDGEHEFVLEPLDEGRRTRLVHAETFYGLLVAPLGKIIDRTTEGFVQMNEALKSRAEHVGQVNVL
jgi:hypothetical protein